MLMGMGCPAATPGGHVGSVMQMSIAGGVMPTAGMACGLVGAERTQPSPVTSNALLLHSGCILVPGDDAVAIEYPVAKAIADRVHRVHPAAASAEARPVHIEERDEGVLQPVRVAKAIDAVSLCVVDAINWLPSRNGCRRREDDVCRLRIVLEVSGCAYRFHGERIVCHVLSQAQGDDVAGHGRRVGPHTL